MHNSADSSRVSLRSNLAVTDFLNSKCVSPSLVELIDVHIRARDRRLLSVYYWASVWAVHIPRKQIYWADLQWFSYFKAVFIVFYHANTFGSKLNIVFNVWKFIQIIQSLIWAPAIFCLLYLFIYLSVYLSVCLLTLLQLNLMCKGLTCVVFAMYLLSAVEKLPQTRPSLHSLCHSALSEGSALYFC